MSDRPEAYAVSKTFSTTVRVGNVTYVNNVPDVREWLLNLRRNLARQLKDIDELLATLPRLDT